MTVRMIPLPMADLWIVESPGSVDDGTVTLTAKGDGYTVPSWPSRDLAIRNLIYALGALGYDQLLPMPDTPPAVRS